MLLRQVYGGLNIGCKNMKKNKFMNITAVLKESYNCSQSCI